MSVLMGNCRGILSSRAFCVGGNFSLHTNYGDHPDIIYSVIDTHTSHTAHYLHYDLIRDRALRSWKI